MSDLIADALLRTQISVEAWHRRLKVLVGKVHTGIYHLIKVLATEHAVVKAKISKYYRGEEVKIRAEYIKQEKRIKKILSKKEKWSKLKLLKGLAQNTSL